MTTSAIIVACSDDQTTTPAVTPGDASAESSTPTADGSTPTADGGSTSDGATPLDSGIYDFCAAKEARDTTCGTGGADDPAECAKEKACYETGFRAGVGEKLEKCITQRACSASDDDCFDTAALPFKDEPSVAAFVTECTTKRNGCEAAGGGSFSDDYCTPVIGLFPTATVDALKTCLALGCTAVSDCFNEKATAVGCGD